ncbi:MAG: glycosyltransferase [Prevotella sp.]|nr:glycosyltransferase [Prevotella sp.]
MIKVSVILPVYNVAPYLGDTFESIIHQSLKDIEIIAVNDGSTDDSATIIKHYCQQDPRIVAFSQENRGQSAARNLALQHARGQYIYMMDSDDLLGDADALQTCYDYAEKNKADFIFFDGDSFSDKKDAHRYSWNTKRTQLVDEDTPYDGEYLLNMMLDTKKHNCVVWLLFIRAEFLKRIGLRFYEGIIHEDELFTTILTLNSTNVYCLRKNLVAHRIRSASTMGINYSKRNLNCYLTVADELLRFRRTPIIHKFLRYTLSKVFYTGHQIPLKDKPGVFWRALRSGYMKYIGFKSALVFWLKSGHH